MIPHLVVFALPTHQLYFCTMAIAQKGKVWMKRIACLSMSEGFLKRGKKIASFVMVVFET